MTSTIPVPAKCTSAFQPRIEDRLLLTCAMPSLTDEADPDVDAMLAAGLEWEYVLAAGIRHGLLPLLHGYLNRHGRAAAPGDVLTRLSVRTRETVAHNLMLAAETKRALQALGAAQIEAVPFKGPTLAEDLYGDLALRPFVDVDVMVRRKDVRAAVTALQAAGYQSKLSVPEDFFDRYVEAACELPFESESGALVELQWDIVPRYFALDLPIDEMWSHLRAGKAGGPLVFEDGDLFLMLCVHGGKHLWSRWLWVCDVGRLAARLTPAQWDRVLDRARRAGALRFVLLGARLAHTLLATPLPQSVIEQMECDQGLAFLQSEILSQSDTSSSDIVDATTFLLRIRERGRDRVRFLWRTLTQPGLKEREAVHLPSALSDVYSLVRAVRASRYLFLIISRWLGLTRRGAGK